MKIIRLTLLSAILATSGALMAQAPGGAKGGGKGGPPRPVLSVTSNAWPDGSEKDLMKAMDGLVVGKALYVGRFHQVQ